MSDQNLDRKDFGSAPKSYVGLWKMSFCPMCNGLGYYVSANGIEYDCPDCDGTGEHSYIFENDVCPFCNGTGIYVSIFGDIIKRCWFCDGTGRL